MNVSELFTKAIEGNIGMNFEHIKLEPMFYTRLDSPAVEAKSASFSIMISIGAVSRFVSSENGDLEEMLYQMGVVARNNLFEALGNQFFKPKYEVVSCGLMDNHNGYEIKFSVSEQ